MLDWNLASSRQGRTEGVCWHNLRVSCRLVVTAVQGDDVVGLPFSEVRDSEPTVSLQCTIAPGLLFSFSAHTMDRSIVFLKGMSRKALYDYKGYWCIILHH